MTTAKKLIAAAGAAGAGEALYVEDVFSTYLYEGSGSTQSIVNGINLGSMNVTSRGYGNNSSGITVGLDHLVEGDVVVVFNTGATTGATATVGGNSTTVLEQDYTSPTYGYIHTTFSYTVASSDPASMDVVITNNTYGGLVTVIKGGVTVSLQAGGSTNTGNTITEPDFSTTGYGLIFTSDRDPDSTSLTTTDPDLTNILIDDSSPFFVHSCWEMDSGNGGTISGFSTGSGYEQVHVVLKVEGAGTTAFGNTEADGGLVWTKNRSSTSNHALFDTERGPEKLLFPDNNAAEQDRTNDNDSLGSFNSDGFTLQASTGNRTNLSGDDFVSWTFRKAPKFFDIVTADLTSGPDPTFLSTTTGTLNGDGTVTIPHSLGCAPGSIWIKVYEGDTGLWRVWHRSVSGSLILNETGAATSNVYIDNVTDTTFDLVNTGFMGQNRGPYSFVFYLFAHNDGDGEFGEDGDQDIIKCGSYTGNGSTDGPEIDLGFEPQWLMIRNTAGSDWNILDNMRGIHSGGTNDARLFANGSLAEYNSLEAVQLQPTGFKIDGTTGGAFNTVSEFVYIAIRRGPMKTPESGTEVFHINTRTGTGLDLTTTGIGFAHDSVLISNRSYSGDFKVWFDRLRGDENRLKTHGTDAESGADSGTGYEFGNTTGTAFLDTNNRVNRSGQTHIDYFFRRAPGFFDVVAYTGTASTSSRTVNHNLTVSPEMIIFKARNNSQNWPVYHKDISFMSMLNHTYGNATSQRVTSVSSTGWSMATADNQINGAFTYIAYLFATLAGVSKVGSYTGTGSNVDVDCGFSAGARFILIKRTDSTGDWYVWDSVRGIVAGNDPYLLLNSTAAEVTSTDYIDPLSSGFTVTSTAPAALNASGGTYIFLAIA